MPLTVPHMLTALRVALGVAWATLVASELIAAQHGLGSLIQNAASFFQLDIIYVGIICIGFIALGMDLALRASPRAGWSRGRSGSRERRRDADRRSTASRWSFRPRTARCAWSTTSRTSIRDRRVRRRCIGPSGCGKTTMLNIVAGFLSPSAGAVLLDGRPITGPGPDRGVIFQEYGVFPWLTVEENIAFGLKLAREPRRRRPSARRSARATCG